MHNEMESRTGFGIRKYPIGLQSFRKIREGGYVYVDKTEIIHRMVTTGSYYFLSRPRRFGKSLLMDTIEELFKGSRELFDGLWVESNWDWSRTNPVLHFNFAEISYKEIGLSDALKEEVGIVAGALGLALTAQTLKGMFRELIQKTAEAYGQAVILIDEYDKPLVDFLDDPAQLENNRSVMKTFYSVLKGQDEHIRFLLLTGVSRFSRVSVFSDLNNLEDISIDDNFHRIVGITQAELERDFTPELADMAHADPDILAKVKEWYNGYSWGGEERLYNPFSVLNLMKSRKFMNHWYTTGTPTFLFEQLKKRKLSDMEGVRASANQLSDFNTDDLDLNSLLFQTGYLTIKRELVPNQLFELGYPNREVRESFLEGLLDSYREPVQPDAAGLTYDLRLAMAAYDVPGMVNALNALIGVIPYDHWQAERESIFTIITVLAFKLAGAEAYSEVHSSRGRCDVLAKTPDYIYVIEVKLDGTAQEALDQILNTNYLQPYLDDRRKKIALGITFSSETRKVAEYLVEEIR